MRKVFRTNSEVIRKFFEQSQDEGYNQSRKMRFEKNKLFGGHRVMVNIMRDKGVVLVSRYFDIPEHRYGIRWLLHKEKERFESLKGMRIINVNHANPLENTYHERNAMNLRRDALQFTSILRFHNRDVNTARDMIENFVFYLNAFDVVLSDEKMREVGDLRMQIARSMAAEGVLPVIEWEDNGHNGSIESDGF
jgi:hypothetical protein